MDTDIGDVPLNVRALCAIGNKTTQVVKRFFTKPEDFLFLVGESPDLAPLAQAMKVGDWSDDAAASLLEELLLRAQRQVPLDLAAISQWVRYHPNDPITIQDCMRVIPPEDVELIRVLSRKGSQKLVFLGKWKGSLQHVVVKQLLMGGASAARILARELRPHPLVMVHPNIIETHFLTNSLNEHFLVERLLSEVLSDEWEAKGIIEASNLLYDIAQALKFLHDDQAVHGDVKPDNIGKRGPNYVLLDFGICRDRVEFVKDATPTGSLRTRAPELLLTDKYPEPEKVDIWALGATIYKVVSGRFPLFEKDEKVPRNNVAEQVERHDFEQKLKARAEREYNTWADLNAIPPPLRDVIAQMLEPNPLKRITSKEVLVLVHDKLSAFLRAKPEADHLSVRFSPLDELRQIDQYVASIDGNVTIIPRHKRHAINARLLDLKGHHGFDQDQKEQLRHLTEVFKT